MSRRRLVLVLIVLVLGFAVAARPEPAEAVELAVVSQGAEADFPAGLTLTLDYDAEQPIEEVYVLYTLAQEDLSFEVVAEPPLGGSTEAAATIDMETSFVPAGVDLTYRWRLVAADGSVVETEPETIVWRDDRFDWERSASADVEVFAYAGGEKLRSKVLASAQDTADRLGDEFSVAVDSPIRVWVYASKRDFDGTLASNSQEWAAGAAYPELGLILAVIPESRPSELGRVIPHEVSHQILAIAADNPYNDPATWLDEGLAVRNQTNGNGHMARLVATAKREGRLLPLTSLNAGFPFDPTEAGLAYAEGFSVVTYLVETYGEPAIATIAAAYHAGSTHDDAIRAGTGRDVAQLDAEWRTWVDDDLGGVADRDGIARVLLYGAPGLGVVAYLVARRFRHHDPYLDDVEEAA